MRQGALLSMSSPSSDRVSACVRNACFAKGSDLTGILFLKILTVNNGN